jgi:flagellar biosynthesis/type III secretory pathway protein FliH
MSFCVQKIEMDDGLRPDYGLLKITALKVTADAHACAESLMDAARASADQIVQQARQQAEAVAAETEQRTLDTFRNYQASFDRQYAGFMQRAQPLIIELALGLFDQLVLSMNERERVAVLATRLAREAPAKLEEAMLHLHPSDVVHLPEPEWPVKPDANLTPGTAVLIASSGEWRMDFSVAVDTLKNSLQRHRYDPLSE